MTEARPVIASMWAFMASWFTPTVLFCVLNLMIGTIFITSKFKTHNKEQQDDSPRLARAPSLLERVRSINFSGYIYEQTETLHDTDPPHHQTPDENPTHGVHGEDRHVARSKSDATGDAPARVEATMKKSASEKTMVKSLKEVVDDRRPATVRERKGKGSETALFGEDEGVDAKADDFINRFRQQLKLQRLDSLLKYKEMLSRGSAN